MLADHSFEVLRKLRQTPSVFNKYMLKLMVQVKKYIHASGWLQWSTLPWYLVYYKCRNPKTSTFHKIEAEAKCYKNVFRTSLTSLKYPYGWFMSDGPYFWRGGHQSLSSWITCSLTACWKIFEYTHYPLLPLGASGSVINII